MTSSEPTIGERAGDSHLGNDRFETLVTGGSGTSRTGRVVRAFPSPRPVPARPRR
ncbi:hypothetical protein [Allosalinactinospora lopnorensis]|uniref:hypothetical protein n=1 Tax=Allosalinactinospora lopnorensis TaxID=1352348 RepID=UPI0012E2AE4C|nr:hypothetical protein [Allosalinactinospora lopnorensis]